MEIFCIEKHQEKKNREKRNIREINTSKDFCSVYIM